MPQATTRIVSLAMRSDHPYLNLAPMFPVPRITESFMNGVIESLAGSDMLIFDSLPGWGDVDGAASRTFGAAWIDEARSAILIVPSVVSREESNILINPAHPDATQIRRPGNNPCAGTSACSLVPASNSRPPSPAA